MLGRAAYENPFSLNEVDQFFEGGKVNNILQREVMEKLIDYIEQLWEDRRMGQQALKNTIDIFHDKRGSRL